MTDPVKFHQVLCIVPDARAIRQRRVELPDINTRILFGTPQSLRDGRIVRGTTLCHIVGENHIDLATTALVRSRLNHPEHRCPGPSIDCSRYLWATVGTDEWR